MRGQAGRARLTDVARKLRDLARREQLALATSPTTAPDLAEAARQAVLLGSRDILLDHLLDLLTQAQRETLLQAALSRTPLPPADLARAAYGEEPAASFGEDVRKLIGLTLLTEIPDGLLVQTWVREALNPLQGAQANQRHERALAMRYHCLHTRRATFDDLTEIARHLGALRHFDELAQFALNISEQIQGELGVATFLGNLLTTFPRNHPLILALLDREREALTNTGSRPSAEQRAQEIRTIARRLAEADPAMCSCNAT